MALGSKVIFSESEQDIKKIEELSNEKELFDMNFYTVVDNTKTYLKGFLKGLFISLGILLIFMITLVFLGGNRLIMLIKKNKRDYLIKMCCGATYRSIRLTNIKLLTLVDILASIPTYIYIFIYNGNLFVFLTVFIVSVALNYIIIWRTFKKASVKNIYELMRRE